MKILYILLMAILFLPVVNAQVQILAEVTSHDLFDIIVRNKVQQNNWTQISNTTTSLGILFEEQTQFCRMVTRKRFVSTVAMYECFSRSKDFECPFGLSNINSKGLQTRCYQSESKYSWYTCREGWFLI